MAYVNGQWVDDNNPFDTPYTNNAQNTEGNPNAGVQLPDASPAPSAGAAPAAAQDPNARSGSFDYGNGIKATQGADGQWYYPWRTQGYQNLLSDSDVGSQQKLTQARTSGQTYGGQHAAEDDASLLAQMNGTATSNAIAQAQGGASRDQYNINSPGFQFNDPYTQQFEQVAQQQISNLSQPQQNPALDQLMQFLGQRFNSLTQTPGYSPEDLAVMRTQALDPIEADRAASQQRALQRAASAGFLPTSGIAQLAASPTGGTETIDTGHDRMRAAAERDLAINAINKRNTDLNQAINVGQMAGVQIPQVQRQEDQQRRSEILNLAQLMYNLPRNALQDSLSVLNGTSGPNDVFQQAAQVQQQQYQQQQQDAAKWAAVGQMIANMAF